MSAAGPPCRERPAVARAARASIGALLGFLGCGDKGPAPSIDDVTPKMAYNDVSVSVTIDAPSVRPGLRVDVDDQSVVVDASTVHLSLIPSLASGLPPVAFGPARWIPTPGRFMARLPAGVAAGVYDVRIEGPNGESATKPAAFVEMGPDPEPPQVNVMKPLAEGTLAAGEMTIVTVTLDDGLGQARDVSLTTPDFSNERCCALTRDEETGDLPSVGTCSCQLRLPDLPDSESTASYWINFTGRDVAGNANSSSTVNLTLGHVPVVTSFEPEVGSLMGGQMLTVHGRYFLPGSQVFIGNMIIGGDVLGGVVLDEMTIVGRTQPHSQPEPLDLEVRSPAGSSKAATPFRYTAAPRVRVVYPESGPAAGGIQMTIGGNDLRMGVAIKFGATLADAQPLVGAHASNDNKVVGCLPPGTGTVSVWAEDTLTGQGTPLVNAFTYTGDARAAQPGAPLCDPAAAAK